MRSATYEEEIHIAHPVTERDLFWAELAEFYITDHDFRSALDQLSERYRINLFNALFDEANMHEFMNTKDMAMVILERVGSLRPSSARECIMKKLRNLKKVRFAKNELTEVGFA